MQSLALPAAQVAEEVRRILPREAEDCGSDMSLTPRAKRCLELADEECNTLQDDFIGTEHILIGLLREGEGIAARMLWQLGFRLEDVRARVLSDREGDDGPHL